MAPIEKGNTNAGSAAGKAGTTVPLTIGYKKAHNKPSTGRAKQTGIKEDDAHMRNSKPVWNVESMAEQEGTGPTETQENPGGGTPTGTTRLWWKEFLVGNNGTASGVW